MYIKQVIIQGFKSYHDQTVVDPFDPGHNVVVGRNGSGKSNFFAAIQFVLSDEFSHLRAEQRQALLHEGPGPRVISAYVEIIFENTDGRIPIEKEEVRLRRVIGAKKDLYFLNKMTIARSDVMNLLETVGFSRTNPYYIVKQGEVALHRALHYIRPGVRTRSIEYKHQDSVGILYLLRRVIFEENKIKALTQTIKSISKDRTMNLCRTLITKMATASDSQRLKLLREVAGSCVYDNASDESKAILEDAKVNLEHVESRLQAIGERLRTLEEEKEELKEYQRWDKQRRCLEYTIHKRELKDTEEKLNTLTGSREKCNVMQVNLAVKKENATRDYNAAIRRLNEAKKEVKASEEELETLRVELQDFLGEKTRLILTIKDLTAEVSSEEEMKKRCQKELEELEPTINEKEVELENINFTYDKLMTEENECTLKLAIAEQKRRELLAKQGRGRQFSSKELRDTWIRNELEKLNEQIEAKEKHLEEIKRDLKEDCEKLRRLTENIAVQTIEIEKQGACIDERDIKLEALGKQKEHAQASRKEKLREEHTLQTKLSERKEELAKVEQTLRSMVGKAILDGGNSIRKIMNTFRERGDMFEELDGYYGQVIDKFDCHKALYTAVEVIGGNRLFHHIVQTDKLSRKILNEMNNQGLPGEGTFMPLNRLSNKIPRYPDPTDATPMMSHLKYDPKYEPALRDIFGRTLLCRDMEIATRHAREFGLNCVTTEGFQVSSKGSLTGGHLSIQTSRIEMQKIRSELVEEISMLKNCLTTVREAIRNADDDTNSFLSETQRIVTLNSRARYTYDKMKGAINITKEELKTMESYRAPKERSCSQCASNLEAMRVTKLELKKEYDQDLVTQLSAAEHEQMDSLNDEIKNLTNKSKTAFAERRQCEVKKNRLENLLTNNLLRQRDALVQSIQKISVADRQRRLNSRNSELADIDNKLVTVNSDFEALNGKVMSSSRKQKVESAEVEKSKMKEKEVQGHIEANMRELVKFTSKQNVLQEKLAKCTSKIAHLGALPRPEAYSKFEAITTKQLFKEIEKTNNQLKNYSHVNKKALEQFVSFSDQKEKLVNRKEELDRGEEKIMELMHVLEQRKNENIQFTFKQVSNYFSKVFEKLVPSGYGELVMKTAKGDVDNVEEVLIGDSQRFTGVGIRVSFTGQTVEVREMNQLSGGQKSLVAIALIFAIQRCDPAPFYLFDEIDQALDADHRKAVADMIHELSSSAQFITTTFKPELLRHADKFYGVTYQGKVSHVKCITQEEATDFVSDEAPLG